MLDGVEDEFSLLEHVWADQGYTGKGRTWIEEHLVWSVEIVQHPPHPRGEWRIVPEPDVPTRGHFEWARPPPVKKEFRGPYLAGGWESGRSPGYRRAGGS